MAITDTQRFSFSTASAAETGGCGVKFDDTQIAYRCVVNSTLTPVFQGSLNDIWQKWGHNAGFTITWSEGGITLPGAASPNTGPAAGGTAVTLTVTNAPVGTTPTVLFDTVQATSVVVVNATTITCVTPAHAAGAVGVTITGITGTVTRANSFTYS